MKIRLLVLSLLLAPALLAEVSGIKILERSAVLNGSEFGKTGSYERVVARARFEVDPEDAANRMILDLKLAPRNAKGRVEFSADVYMLKPTEPGRGSGTALFEVANRGGKGMLGMFNRANRSLDPRTAEEFGDGFLFERGYTLVWVGWQFDLLEGEHVLRMQAPVARGVSGWTRSSFIPSSPATEFSVAGDRHQAYPAANPADPQAKLIVRDYPDGAGREIPRKSWRFRDAETVTLDDGFAAGKTYDVIYRAEDPGVAGLGAAAIRDFISFLKFGSDRELAELSRLERAIAFGASQSGRFLRTFLYEGYNADEQGRRVFDGVWPHIAGAAQGSFTHRFAQPTRTDPYYTVEIFPFRDLSDEDPLTAGSGGILSRAEQVGVTPKVIYTLTSSEYQNRSASLMHTTLDGKDDAPLADQTRIYYFAGTQHGSGSVPPRQAATLAYAANSNGYAPMMRALLVALDEWVTNGKQPPPSKYPSVEELTPLEKLRFPEIPGVRPLGHQRRALPLDFGPEYAKKGIIAYQPPRVLGKPYAAKMPRLDEDGNELGGIRLPSMAAPLATYTGWNRFKTEVSDSDYNPGNSGSTLPFAWTKAERLEQGDPRRAVLERYANREEYSRRVTAAAQGLVSEGYLLKNDAPVAVGQALELWDYLEKNR